MALGFNRTIQHEGRRLHIQIEDMGGASAVFEVRIYEGGQVLFHKRVAHGAALAHESPHDRKERLKSETEQLLATLTAAIHKGRLDLKTPD